MKEEEMRGINIVNRRQVETRWETLEPRQNPTGQSVAKSDAANE